MILVFIILGIVILSCFAFFIFALSTLKIEVDKLHISNKEEKLKVDFVLNIAVYFLNKLKLLKITIDNEKINNLLNSGKIDIQKLKDNKPVNKDILKALKNAKFTIELFNIKGYFATFNTVLSSGIYAFVCAIIPIFVAPKLNGKFDNKIEFLNVSENLININLRCIICVKMVNIINILSDLKKKGGKQDNGGKSSNRRAYAHRYE